MYEPCRGTGNCPQLARAFARQAALGKRTHPGEQIIYILEWALEYQIEDSRRRRSTPVMPWPSPPE